MEPTHHIGKRMAQRGITKALVELAFELGTPSDDKYILGRKQLKARLDALEHERRLVIKALDKGGLVVVAEGDKFITTYRYEGSGHT